MSIIIDEAMFYEKLISLSFIGACILVHEMMYEETAASPINMSQAAPLMLAQLKKLEIQVWDGFIWVQDRVLDKTTKF